VIWVGIKFGFGLLLAWVIFVTAVAAFRGLLDLIEYVTRPKAKP